MVKEYTLLRKQGIGGIGVPVVTVGDTVRRGQLLVRAEGLGADLHASVDGTVCVVDDDAVVLTASEHQEEDFLPFDEPTNVRAAVRAAGLVGMGGAGFPTHVKLDTDLHGGVLIVNSVECEPFLGHNIAQLETEPERIRSGALYAMQAVDAARVILAIKAKHQDSIRIFQDILRPGDPITVAQLPDLYPMGEERAVIRETLGTLLPPDQLPSAAGAVVVNLETVANIASAVEQHRPVITKDLTVVGNVGGKARTVLMKDVPIGTPLSAVIEEAGGMPEDHGEIIVGGPFTGKRADPDAVVTKTTGGIIVTEPFQQDSRPVGLLVCACGANEDRLRQIAASMGAPVVGIERCKQVCDVRGALKCENPGICPGQAERVLALRKVGAQILLVANCTDCTNTVMALAPKLGLPVYHSTDHVMRTMGHPLIRKME